MTETHIVAIDMAMQQIQVCAARNASAFILKRVPVPRP